MRIHYSGCLDRLPDGIYHEVLPSASCGAGIGMLFVNLHRRASVGMVGRTGSKTEDRDEKEMKEYKIIF